MNDPEGDPLSPLPTGLKPVYATSHTTPITRILTRDMRHSTEEFFDGNDGVNEMFIPFR